MIENQAQCLLDQKERLTGFTTVLLGAECQLLLMFAGREELSPFIQGSSPRGEEGGGFLQEAQSAGLAVGVVACQVPLEEVPGDGEVFALPSQLVDVAAEGGAWLVVVLLLHDVHRPIVPLPERPPCQPCTMTQALLKMGN